MGHNPHGIFALCISHCGMPDVSDWLLTRNPPLNMYLKTPCSVPFLFYYILFWESRPWLAEPETSLIIEGSLRLISRLAIQATHQLDDYENMYLCASLHRLQGYIPIGQMREPCQLKAKLLSRKFRPPSLSAWMHRPADSCTVTLLDTKSQAMNGKRDRKYKARLDATKDAEQYPAIPFLNCSIGCSCGYCCNCVLIPIRLVLRVIVY